MSNVKMIMNNIADAVEVGAYLWYNNRKAALIRSLSRFAVPALGQNRKTWLILPVRTCAAWQSNGNRRASAYRPFAHRNRLPMLRRSENRICRFPADFMGGQAVFGLLLWYYSCMAAMVLVTAAGAADAV